LHEGHLAYDFMTVEQAERFHGSFYPKWKKEFYYDLMDRMNMNYDHKISKMSCGQRSQVALGLIMAQDPELMILDDYSMGLDAGYRRLFIDYLKYYVKERGTTVLITSHIIQDLENLIDKTIIIGYQKILLQMEIKKFMEMFHLYRFTLPYGSLNLDPDEVVANHESVGAGHHIYSFKPLPEIEAYLRRLSTNYQDLTEEPMTLEDAFIGLTGKY